MFFRGYVNVNSCLPEPYPSSNPNPDRVSLSQVDCNIQGGQLPFPYCTVWDNNVNTECIGPDTVEPGTTSKCKCSEAEIFVPLCVVSLAVL